MEENWAPVKDFEGLYEVSDLGNVKSLITNRLLSIRPNGKEEYCQVSLTKNKRMYTKKVHRLVAEAFVPNPNGYQYVNHKDEQKKNNVASNLEWCTFEYNVNYGTRNERGAKARINNPKRSKIVEQYDLNGNLINVFPSLNEANRVTGKSLWTLSNFCQGKQKDKKFIWKYR